MSSRRWLLITVSDASPASQANLRLLLSSVEDQGGDVDMILVMRGGGDAPDSRTVRIHTVESPVRIALSAARNLALGEAQARSWLDASRIVAFPDDDARYPAGLMAGVQARVGGDIALACGAYAPRADGLDHARFPATAQPLTPGLVMRVASSNDVFFRGDVIHALGGFDERFGLGARFGAGEDSDYLLRALERGYRGRYDPALLVLHPYKAHRPAEYYPGNVAVLARHLRGGRTGLLLARRLATGLLMTARRRLSRSDYAGVLRSAVALGLRGGTPELPLRRSASRAGAR